MSERHADLQQWLDLANEAARLAGQALKTRRAEWMQVTAASERDVKLKADVEAERIALECLGRSPFPIFSEEAGLVGAHAAGEPIWLIDPLDGTFNFSRGQPSCACSIALVAGSQPVLGVVYDFNRSETFSGAVGQGLLLNGTPVSVSGVAGQRDAVLMTGFPANRDFSESALAATARDWQRWRKVRLIGSAALSLAYVACGRADAYHEENIMLWDVAAGLALVRAGGGTIHLSQGAHNAPRSVWATNGRVSLAPPGA